MRASILLLLALSAGQVSAQRTLQVSPGGLSITRAIQQARPGDRIVLAPGVYREPTIIVDRPVTIVGAPGGGAVLDGGAATHILRIEADDVTVRGLTFRNGRLSHIDDHAAVRAGAVKRCRIEDNRFDSTYFGIYLAGSMDCVVARNELRAYGGSEGRTGNGIHLWTATNAEITDNRIRGHRDGIYLEFAEGVRVTGNVAEGNVRYGLHFMSADECHYERNVFKGNHAGVAVMYTKRITMVHNRFEDNWGPASFGLLLKEIYDSRVDSNTFARNTTAMLADGATRMQARDNLFVDNGWAIKLMASTSDAAFTGNVFSGNTFDMTTNSRGTTNVLSGNYWDRYEGYDLNRDGIGDVPHRPVRLFSLIVERNEPTMILMRSAIIGLLDRVERLLPSLTPETLADPSPLMRRPR